MNKAVLGLSIAVALIACVGLVGAEHGKGGPGCGPKEGPGFMGGLDDVSYQGLLLRIPWERVEQLAKAAGLDAKQLDSIQKIRQDHMKIVEPLHSQMQSTWKDLQELIGSGDPATLQDAEKLAGAMNEIHGKVTQEMIATAYKLTALLTPEQKEAIKKDLAAMGEERREHMREKHDEKRDERHERNHGDAPPAPQEDNPAPEHY